MKVPRCRICGCWELNACGAGCSWVLEKLDRQFGGKPERGPICSECFEFKKALALFFAMSVRGRVAAGRLLREVAG